MCYVGWDRTYKIQLKEWLTSDCKVAVISWFAAVLSYRIFLFADTQVVKPESSDSSVEVEKVDNQDPTLPKTEFDSAAATEKPSGDSQVAQESEDQTKTVKFVHTVYSLPPLVPVAAQQISNIITLYQYMPVSKSSHMLHIARGQ